MSGKQKVYFLLNKIVDKKELTPKGQPIFLHPADDLNNEYSDIELSQIYTKLEKDEHVIKVLKSPTGDPLNLDPYADFEDGHYYLKLLPAFDNYYLKIQQEPEYQEFTGKKPHLQTSVQVSTSLIESLYMKIAEVDEQIRIRREAWAKAQSTINDNPFYAEATRTGHLAKLEEQAQTDIGNFIKQKETYLAELNLRKSDTQLPKSSQAQPSEEKSTIEEIYRVTYSEQTRKIVINNFLIKQTRSFSENDSIFAYLYKNPNEDKSDEDIKAGTGLKSIKDLNKFIENIGFKGNLRKVFFKVSKSKIRFNNPITKMQLKELGIEELVLQ